MSLRRRSRRNAYGFVLPTRLMVFSISVVALAGLVFVATQNDESPDQVTPSAASSSTPTPTPYDGPQNESTEQPEPEVTPSATPKPPIVVKRAEYNLVVFNNTNIKGLAGKTADRSEKAGWTVINTDNWVGSVDMSTVYYGPGAEMKAAAALLAKDLGIKRIKPFISPMRPDRLTVILTTDYQ